MSYRPLHDFIHIEPVYTSASLYGLYVHEDDKKPTRGIVLAMGPGARDEKTLELRPMPAVKVGDTIAFTKDAVTILKDGKVPVCLVKAANILGVEES